ncbi:hypothetical protein RB628_22865 [Streptomyces sp. ADMS]|uniref:hypothetical protein n=1 Tax=Streptomyces sp. ADMS TaxID=3071415 RepID=UPI00296EF6B9|nr:hypothetical protein [Streptomyces sp. ADMS]MDW4908109.1 hypothetical protein [Streptomyces sp. ADMS]
MSSPHPRTTAPWPPDATDPLLSPRLQHASGVGTFHFAPGTPRTADQDGAGSEERDARTGIAYPAPVQINMAPVSAADRADATDGMGDPGWSVSSWRPAGSPDRARFESLYRDREWRQRSVALEFTLAGAMGQLGQITESARDGVLRMYEGLVARHGEAAAQRAFFAPDAVPADPAAALERLRTLPSGPLTLDELMTALTYAAYAGAGLPGGLAETLSRPVGRRARHAQGSAYRAVHDSRGFRRVGAEGGPALRLLRTYAELGASSAQLLAFRGALIAWMVPADLQSLHEILRASHLLGMGDAEERGTVLRDGAELHNWAHDSARQAGLRRFTPGGRMIPPHRALYAERMAYGRSITPSGLDLPDDLVNMVDAALAGISLSDTRRGRALDAWLRRYGPEGRRALDRLDPAHLTAIHLYSGPDYRLMKAFLNGERFGAGMSRRLVRLSVWSMTRKAAEVGQADFVPMMLRKHPGFADLFDQMWEADDLGARTNGVARLRRRLDVMADWVYVQLPLHVDMTVEALEILPPVDADVWWGDRGIPGSLDGPPVDGPIYGRDTVTMPFFRSTSLLPSTALGFMQRGKGTPGDSHRGVVYVPRSTAREVSPFVVFISEAEAAYPPGAFFRIVGRGVVRGGEGTVSYESISAQEARPPGEQGSDRSLPALHELGSPDDLFRVGPAAGTAEQDRPAPVTREIRGADGRVVGVASFDDADWAVRRDAYARLDGVTGFVSWERDAEGRPVAMHRALPGGGSEAGTFFFASHGGAEGLAMATEDGGVRRDDGSYAGRLLGGVRGRGFRSVTVLACGPGDVATGVAEARARAQRIADASDLPVHLAVGRAAVTDGLPHLLEDAEGRATEWVTAYPAGWPVPPAAAPDAVTGTPASVGYPAPEQHNVTPTRADATPEEIEQIDAAGGGAWSVSTWQPAGRSDTVRFAGFHRDREWRRRSVAFEFTLADALSGVPELTQVAKQAVRELHKALAARNGEERTPRAFFAWDAMPEDPRAELERLLALPSGPETLDRLMTVFTHAAYAGPGLPSEVGTALFRRPDGTRGRYSPDSAYRAVHDSRGFRRVGGERGPALRLLRMFAALGLPPSTLPVFRTALTAWMIPADLQSLHEILCASHLIGMGDPDERAATGRDAAGLHNWARDHIAEGGLLRLAPADRRLPALIPPHQAWYDAMMTFPAALTDTVDVPGDLVAMVDAALAGTLPPATTERLEAMSRWLDRYGSRGTEALKRLAPAHITALYLYSGPDYRLMKALLNGERFGPGMGRHLVRLTTWRLMRDAVLMEDPGELPLVLLSQLDFLDVFDELNGLADLETPTPELSRPRRRLDAIAAQLYEDLKLHVDMAIEALEILPPVGGDVWWGDRGAPGPLDRPSVNGPVYGAETIEVPFFRSTSLQVGQAREFALKRLSVPRNSHRKVVRVRNSTAREGAPFFAFPMEDEALYPPGMRFDIISRRRVDGDRMGPAHEIQTVEESTPLPDGHSAASRAHPLPEAPGESGAVADDLFDLGSSYDEMSDIDMDPDVDMDSDADGDTDAGTPVTREILGADGQVVGVASFDDADWAVRRDTYARLDGATEFVSWEREAGGRPVATLKALPGGGAAGGTFFFASHGGAEGLALAEDGGGVRRDDGAYAGRLLAGVRSRGFRSVTVLACGPADVPGSVAEAEERAGRLADAVGLPVHLEVGRTAVTGGRDGGPALIHALEDSEGRATVWVTAYPAGRPATDAPASDTGRPIEADYPAPGLINADSDMDLDSGSGEASEPDAESESSEASESDDDPPMNIPSWRVTGAPDTPRFTGYYGNPHWRQRSVDFEITLAQLLAAHPDVLTTVRQTVGRAHQFLVQRYGQEAATQALFPPQDPLWAAPGGPLAQLLGPGATAPLSQLMWAYANAVFANAGSPATISRALPGRIRHAGQPVQRLNPADPASWQRHDALGFRQVGGVNGPALWLLQSTHELGATPAEIATFRAALIAWAVPEGLQSLHEVLRASHLIGLGGAEERLATERDAARMHGWARDHLVPWQQIPQTPEGIALGNRLRAPHVALYSDAVSYPREATGDLAVPADLLTMVDALLSPGPSTFPDEERMNVAREWLARYGAEGRAALRRMAPSHVTALFIYSMSDYRLMKAVLNGERFGRHAGRWMLRSVAWSMVTRGVYNAGEWENFVPLTLRTQPGFGEVMQGLMDLTDLEPSPEVSQLRRRLDEIVDGLHGQLKVHIEMAVEALELLPPVRRTVWWGDRGVPGSLARPAANSPLYNGAVISVPFFRSTSLDIDEALDFALSTKRAPSKTHRGVFEIPDSLGKEIAMFSAFSSESEVLYPPGSFFLGQDRTIRTYNGDARRQKYAYSVVKDATGNRPAAPPRPAAAPADPVDGDQQILRSFYADPRWWTLSGEYEKALGEVLAHEPAVLDAARAAVRVLYTYLSHHLGARAAASAFFPERSEANDPQAEMDLLLDEDMTANVRTLVLALVDAGYASANEGAGPSLNRLWGNRPELNVHNQLTSVEDASPHRRSGHWYRDRHDRLGHGVGNGRAEGVEWLLRAFRSLPGTDPALLLGLRNALLAARLMFGEHSLAEVLEAAQSAGVRDEAEPEPGDVEAARLYAWADAVFAPRKRIESEPGLRREFADDSTLRERLRLPHQRMYQQRTAWLAPWITGDVAEPAAITELAGLEGSTWSAEDLRTLPWPTGPAARERRSALRDWLLRHETQALLRNVTAAHVPALYLISGPDGTLTDPRLTTGPESLNRLRQTVGALVQQRIAQGAPDQAFPLTLLRDTRLRTLVREARSVPPSAPNRAAALAQTGQRAAARAAELAAGIRGELAVLRRMGREALHLLPPVDAPVYWSAWEAGTLEEARGRSMAGLSFTSPPFHTASASRSVGLRMMPGRPPQGESHPVLYEVRRSSARDVAPFSRTPAARQTMFPEATRFEEESREVRYDASPGRSYAHVILREVPAPALPAPEQWDREILTRPVIAPDGTWSGVTSYTAQEWSERHDAIAHLPRLTYFKYYDTEAEAWEDDRVPVPWSQGSLFFAAPSDGRLVQVGSRYGSKLATAGQVGSFLRELLRDSAARENAALVVFGSPAGAGPLAQRIADRSGHDAVGSTAPSETYERGEGANPYGLELEHDPGRPAPRWLIRTPRAQDGTEDEAPRDPSRHAERFAAVYADPRWPEAARDWERALGSALAGDPRVTAAARAAVRAVHRFVVGQFGEAEAASMFFSASDDDAGVDLDAALRRLLDPDAGAGLPELMEAYARGAGLSVWFTPPKPLDREGNWYREFHRDRGFPVGHGPADIARDALSRYSRLSGVRWADVLAFREAVISWQLSLDRHSLIEVLLASHTLGLGDTVERAAALGDAVHLYQWADDALTPRSRPGSQGPDGSLRLPHRRLYGTGAGRFPPEATGAGTVPDGLVVAVQRGERLLSGEFDPEKLLGREEALLDWQRRHGGSPLDGLDRAHVTALHLLGGPDAALLGKPDPVVQARSFVARELRNGGLAFPVLLMNDPGFRGLAAQAKAIAEAAPDGADRLAALLPAIGQRIGELAPRIQAEVSQHTAFGSEALDRLPPVNAPVWWAAWLPGDLPSGPDGTEPPGPLDGVSTSSFHVARRTEETALDRLTSDGDPPAGRHPAVFEVERSSGRDVSVFAGDPEDEPVAYPEPADFRVLRRSLRTHPETGRRYEHVLLAETAATSRALAAPPTPSEAAVPAYPEPDFWNAPWEGHETARPLDGTVVQEIRVDGRTVGKASFSRHDWSLRERPYGRLPEVTDYTGWSRGPGGERVARRRPLPATGRTGTFFWASHGKDSGYALVGQDDIPVGADAEMVGRLLGGDLAAAGFTSVTVLACDLGAVRDADTLARAVDRAQGIADTTNLDVYTNTGGVAVTPGQDEDGGATADIHLLESADGSPTTWLRISPRGRAGAASLPGLPEPPPSEDEVLHASGPAVHIETRDIAADPETGWEYADHTLREMLPYPHTAYRNADDAPSPRVAEITDAEDTAPGPDETAPRGTYRRTGPYAAELDGTVFALHESPGEGDRLAGTLLLVLRYAAPETLTNEGIDTPGTLRDWLGRNVTDDDLSQETPLPLDRGRMISLRLLDEIGAEINTSQRTEGVLLGNELPASGLDLSPAERFRLLLRDPSYGSENGTGVLADVVLATAPRALGVELAVVDPDGQVTFHGGTADDDTVADVPPALLVRDGDRYLSGLPDGPGDTTGESEARLRRVVEAVSSAPASVRRRLATRQAPDWIRTRIRYMEEAERFEERLGRYLGDHEAANAQLGVMVREVFKRAVAAGRWAELGSADPTTDGAVGTDWDRIVAVVESGNLRERMGLLWIGAPHPAGGLISDLLGTPAPVPQSIIDEYGERLPSSAMTAYREVRAQSHGMPPEEQARLLAEAERTLRAPVRPEDVRPPLSEAERALMPDADIPWIPGRNRWDYAMSSRFQAATEATSGLVLAGTSGSSQRLMTQAVAMREVWGLDIDLGLVRIALLAEMLTARHHSLHEIMRGCQLVFDQLRELGTPESPDLDYVDNWGRYWRIDPLTEAELREHVAVDGRFPDEHAPDATSWPTGAGPDGGLDEAADPDTAEWLAAHRDTLGDVLDILMALKPDADDRPVTPDLLERLIDDWFRTRNLEPVGSLAEKLGRILDDRA